MSFFVRCLFSIRRIWYVRYAFSIFCLIQLVLPLIFLVRYMILLNFLSLFFFFSCLLGVFSFVFVFVGRSVDRCLFDVCAMYDVYGIRSIFCAILALDVLFDVAPNLVLCFLFVVSFQGLRCWTRRRDRSARRAPRWPSKSVASLAACSGQATT